MLRFLTCVVSITWLLCAGLTTSFALGSPVAVDQSVVEISLSSGAESVSSVQVSLTIPGAPGLLRAGRGNVSCEPAAGFDGLFTFYVCDPGKKRGCRVKDQVNVALVSTNPIYSGSILFRCSISGGPQDLPARDFDVKNVDLGLVAGGRTLKRNASAQVSRVFRTTSIQGAN